MSPSLPYNNNTLFNANTSYYQNATAEDHTAATKNFVWYALGASLLATSISLFNVFKHLANYTRPDLQKSLTRILFIVPFYAIFSFLGLADPPNSLIYESVRDVWEAFVIYEFLKLVLAYCGGENACLQVIMRHPGQVSHVWPLGYCFRPMVLDARFMRTCKQFTLQFVLIKPLMAAANITMLELGMVDNRLYQNAQLFLYNVSYSFALYGLVLFYMATHHHPSLASRRPILKFLSIKTIIFATYYQSLLVQLTPGFDRHELESINNLILCFEMVFFAIMHIFAFGWFEYVDHGKGLDSHDALNGDVENGVKSGQIALSQEVIAGLRAQQDANKKPEPAPEPGVFDPLTKHFEPISKHLDPFARQFENTMSVTKETLQNAREAANMADVMDDTIQNFGKKYGDVVMLDTNEKAERIEVGDEAEDNPFEVLAAVPSTAGYDAPSSSSARRTPRAVGRGNRRVEPDGGDGDGDAAEQEDNPFAGDLHTI